MDISKRSRRRGVAVFGAVAALAIYMVVVAMPASAAVTCAVTGTSPNEVMTVTLDADTDSVTLAVDGANIEWDNNACTPAATTAGVSAIVVNAEALLQDESQTVTIDGSGGTFSASIDISLGAGNDVLNVNDTVAADGVTADLGDGDDDLNTTNANGPLTVSAGAGLDNPIEGGNGDDSLNAGAGDDNVTGGDGADTIDAGSGDDSASGGDADDTIGGGDGVDMLDGDADRDTISGGANDDILNGDDGKDTLRPGEGDDEVDGGAHKDTVSFSDATAAVDVDLSSIPGTASTGADDDTLLSIEDVTGSNHGDTIRGDGGNNDVRAGKGADAVRGADGDDNIRGGNGADRLRGGDGDDDIFGQKGNDNLFGGPGTDFCKGGKGRDTVRACE
jgi:Ca2+-binding RTX toxin-like protein